MSLRPEPWGSASSHFASGLGARRHTSRAAAVGTLPMLVPSVAPPVSMVTADLYSACLCDCVLFSL